LEERPRPVRKGHEPNSGHARAGEQADLKVDLNYPGLPKPRTEKMLMIEVVVSSGTEADRKTRLLAALVEALDGAGTDPNDIMVFFGEIDRASSSFGGGRLAPPVASV
jgi:hypothetical protein